ncbi:hypothetical protein N431DRAFT_557614 [Stipitochalara longipes BDJ]|nr:hypothetical protein N431DRAFT_557614 [Stipitochalara longipes BDJ]
MTGEGRGAGTGLVLVLVLVLVWLALAMNGPVRSSPFPLPSSPLSSRPEATRVGGHTSQQPPRPGSASGKGDGGACLLACWPALHEHIPSLLFPSSFRLLPVRAAPERLTGADRVDTPKANHAGLEGPWRRDLHRAIVWMKAGATGGCGVTTQHHQQRSIGREDRYMAVPDLPHLAHVLLLQGVLLCRLAIQNERWRLKKEASCVSRPKCVFGGFDAFKSKVPWTPVPAPVLTIAFLLSKQAWFSFPLPLAANPLTSAGGPRIFFISSRILTTGTRHVKSGEEGLPSWKTSRQEARSHSQPLL